MPAREKVTMIMTKHILMVGEEPTFLSATSLSLRRVGYTVTVATSGDEGISRIMERQKTDKPFDLMILDIPIMGMLRAGLFEKIREHKAATPVIAVVGNADYPIADLLSQKVPMAMLTKPFESLQLVKTIEVMMRPK
jgi:CheY-like chemotaxis protein